MRDLVMRVESKDEHIIYSVLPQDVDIQGDQSKDKDYHEHKAEDWHGKDELF